MGLSLTYLSLVILFNSFFMANYLLMRALRRHMDATFRQRRNNGSNSSANKTSSSSLKERILQNKTLLIVLGPPLALYLKVEEMVEKYESEEGGSAKRGGTLDMVIAFCFGYTRKKKYDSRRFPNWDPIPYRLGAITTSTLIVLFAVIFSDTVLNNILGLDPNSTSPMGGVCTDDGMQSKVDTITTKLLTETNLAAAINQRHITTKFLEALQDDTALWGERQYPCTKMPYTKQDFQKSPSYGKDAGLYFFPGQCQAARKSAMDTARSQTCMEEFCAIGSVVDPDSIYAENGEITGLDDLRSEYNAVMQSANNLKAVCKRCPNDGWDAGIMAIGSIFGSKPKVSAEVVGREKLQANIESAGNAMDNIGITEPTVDYGYTDESFCGVHEVPCPDFSKYDDLTDLVQDHRLAYLERFAKPDVEVPIPPVETDEIQEAYYEYLKRVLGQLEIASYLYAGYTCISLFFPSPQIVFKVNFSHGIRQFLFGVGKHQFLVGVLVIWWTITYFQTFPIFTQLELYMKVLVQDPCVARREYAEDIGGNFTAICNSMLSARSNWTNTYQTINNTLQLIQPMTECCTDYPYKEEALWNFHNKYQNSLIDSGFSKSSAGACTDYDCYLPIEEPTFLGNMTSCENYDFVRQEIIELNEASTITWWDVWIHSGVLASLLLSPVVANFGLGLAKLADPFMVCDGKYEGPPSGFNFQDSEVMALMDEIRISMKISAFGRVVLWGIFMNVLLLNVILGKMEDDEEFAVTVEDAVVAGFILAISAVTVFVAARADRLLSKRISIFEELDEEIQSNESRSRQGDEV